MEVTSAFLCILLTITSSQLQLVQSESAWIWDGDVISNTELTGHVIADIYNIHVITQCARKCFYDQSCMSFNFASEAGHCQLNSMTRDRASDDVTAANGTVYVNRGDITADVDVLGPCYEEPCSNDGLCLDATLSPSSVEGYMCDCELQWAGQQCTDPGIVIEWGAFGEWTLCSVTCGDGWQTRDRKCLDTTTGSVLDSSRCEGNSQQSQACRPQDCPLWDAWQDWSECTTLTTCGLGQTERSRTCLNQGQVDVDRYCKGPTVETMPCSQPECQGPVKLSSGSDVGLGYIMLYDDINDSWVYACADDWSLENNDVVCKQLGYRAGADILDTPSTPVPDATMFLMSLGCDGSEASLQSCSHLGWTSPAECPSNAPAAASCVVDGGFSNWSDWSECSVTCANGQNTRTRSCDSPAPMRGGDLCEGEDEQFRDCTEIPCPVDGEWNMWSDWGACNLTCGGGHHQRDRTCNTPAHGGDDCDGAAFQVEPCNTHPCPVDGYWDVWSTWQDCSVTCNGGQQVRTRECVLPLHGGGDCLGESEDTQECGTINCPENCEWHEWDLWQECNVTCGDGHKMRSRDRTWELYGGLECVGDETEITGCNPRPCEIHGYWEDWTVWTSCSTTCENGTQERSRTCVEPLHGGDNCTGPDTEQKDCFLRYCPVDGSYSEWSSWGACNMTCGGGHQMRSRDCNEAQYGGVTCTELGEAEDWQNCNDHPCAVDGSWTLWTRWFDCSVTCGGGSQYRYRNCTESLHGGNDCEGDSEETMICNTESCPIDGYWGNWTEWTICTEPCGGGVTERNRECVSPLHGGLDCRGPTQEQLACNTHECPVNGYWNMWTAWAPCDVTCGGGTQDRSRECVEPQHGGATCEGNRTQQQECGTMNCPVDGVYSPWTEWNPCNQTCGGGVHSRSRICTPPLYDGDDCVGPAEETEDCNVQPCAVHGYWLVWTSWAECNRTCGGGTRIRERDCIEPEHNGTACEGPSVESEDCNTQTCAVDCVWFAWSSWGECSVTCGTGEEHRQRDKEVEIMGGLECEGPAEEVQECHPMYCPVDCVWHEWSEWETCGVTCGNGTQRRTRGQDVEQHDGTPCTGDEEEWQDCFPRHCPIDCVWNDWAEWQPCNVTCGDGYQLRTRDSVQEMYDGLPCEGSTEDWQSCFPRNCPIDGVWESWSDWTICTRTCGGGTTNRNRTCIEPMYDGEDCPGEDAQLEDCNTQPCPIPGEWNTWESWSTCTVTCGGGTRDRYRTCNMTSYGDLTIDCIGELHDIGECHTYPCNPLMRSCGEYLTAGLVDSAYVQVEIFQEMMEVHCNLSADGTQVSSMFHHQSEGRHQVQGFEGAGEFSERILYVDSNGDSIDRSTISLYIDYSSECEQYIRWECFAASIHSPTTGGTTTFWENRHNEPMDYWGGAAPDTASCACGMDGSCQNSTVLCNCDLNDAQWRMDDGYLTYKDDLPVAKFRAGDTGRTGSENGYYTIGPVSCVSNFNSTLT